MIKFMNLNNLEIVLVGTRHAGNIGATARVMKNMNISRLILINPSPYRHLDAIKMASGAEDIIINASIYKKLEDSMISASWVVGTTSRARRLRREVVTPEELVKEAIPFLSKNKIAVLFGPENFGLNNNEIRFCQSFVSIPVNEKSPSLNLAQAVGIIAYEFNKSEAKPIHGYVRKLISNKKKSLFYSRLKMTLENIGFLDTPNPDRSMASARNIFERSGMDNKDFNLMMGILKEIKRSRNK